jgi:hypothetical protein
LPLYKIQPPTLRRKYVVPPDEYIEKEKANQAIEHSIESKSKGHMVEHSEARSRSMNGKEDWVSLQAKSRSWSK